MITMWSHKFDKSSDLLLWMGCDHQIWIVVTISIIQIQDEEEEGEKHFCFVLRLTNRNKANFLWPSKFSQEADQRSH